MDVIAQITHHLVKSKYLLIIVGIIIGGSVYYTHNDLIEDSSNQLSLRNLSQLPSHFKSNLLIHLFMKNITQYPYFGNWTRFSHQNNPFDNSEGESIVYLSSNVTHSNINKTNHSAIVNNTSFKVFFYLKDGPYTDTLFKGNFSLAFPPYFNHSLFSSMNSLTELRIANKNKTVTLSKGEYYDETTNETFDSCDIELTFYPKQKLMASNNIERVSSNLFSKLRLRINNTVKGFEVDIVSTMQSSEGYSVRLLNYSIMLSVIGLIQIYFSSKALTELNTSIQYGLNMDLVTIGLEIIWGAILSAVHFFFALTRNGQLYEYGTPSLVHFLLFSIFQLRILFSAWKCRYNDLFSMNIIQFRRKLFKFYSFFYIGLLIALVSLRYWYHCFSVIYIQFTFTWLFQIIHSAYYGTKPSFSHGYIFTFTFAKLFIPIYFKGYSGNILGVRPSYLKVALITVTLLLEAIVLSLQKILGPKFLIPKSLRKKGYNYYRDSTEIKELHNECVICLEKLDSSSTDITIAVQEVKEEEKQHSVSYWEKVVIYLKKLNRIKKKEFMVTSCGHVFHTPCLEKWLEMKNECPYCRNKTPPLEY